MPQTKQMERDCETQTSTTHLIFSVVAGKVEALSGVSKWLDAVSSSDSGSWSCFWHVCVREQLTRILCLLLSLKRRSDKLFFCLLFCVDISNLLHAVWGSGVISWISKDGDAQPLALPICRGLWLWFSTLSSVSGASDKFCHGGRFLRMRFLFGNLWNKIKERHWRIGEESTNTQLWFSPHAPLVSPCLPGYSGLFHGERSPVWGWWIPQRVTTVL